MKKIALIIAGFLASMAVFGQSPAIVTGTIKNCSDHNISLSAPFFDLKTMCTQENGIRIPIKPQGTFAIEVKNINRPFTLSWLIVEDTKLPIVLSPGDSIHIELDYWAVLNSARFTGKSAGNSTYYLQYYLKFKQTDRYENILNTDTHYLDQIKRYRSDEDSLLQTALDSRIIDSAYFTFESDRIRYEYGDKVLYKRYATPNHDVGITQEIGNMMKNIDLKDSIALCNYSEYRSLITRYIDYLVAQDLGVYSESKGFPKRMALAERLLYPGVNYSYYGYAQCKSVYDNARNDTQEEVYNHLINTYRDPELTRLLKNMETQHPGWRKPFHYWMDPYALSCIIVVLIVILLSVGIIFYRQHLKRRNKRLNTMSVLKYLLLLFVLLWFMVLVFGKTKEYRVWSLAMLAFIAAQVFWLIPKLFIKKKYGVYYISLLMMVVAYFSVCHLLYFNRNDQIIMNYSRAICDWLRLSAFSIYLGTLFSFIYYYVSDLARKNQPIKTLFDTQVVSIEQMVNVLFVSFAFLILTSLTNGVASLWLTILFILFVSVLYIHALILIPHYFFQRKYWKFVLYSSGILVALGVVLSLIDCLFQYQQLTAIFGSDSPNLISLIRFPQYLEVYLAIIPAFIYAYIKRSVIEKTNQGYALFHNKEAELQQLRSQVNPHFLFNSLNTVYAFSLKENNPKTAECIAKLANLMRYLIDDMDKDKIPVEKEMDYLRDYINLQKIRCSVDHRIAFDTEIEQPGFMIAPMLMIPFVENAFKHGMNPNKASDLSIKIQVKENRFVFVIENSVDKSFEAYYKEKGFGIGIQNVRQRLAYIYPNQHTLSIADTQDKFIVFLTTEGDTGGMIPIE